MTGLANPGKLAARAAWHRSHGNTETAAIFERALTSDGRCKRCGRTLTDPASVARGTGPECATKEEP